jgi:hypothetical protein
MRWFHVDGDGPLSPDLRFQVDFDNLLPEAKLRSHGAVVGDHPMMKVTERSVTDLGAYSRSNFWMV